MKTNTSKMKTIYLKNIIREEIRKVLKEDMSTTSLKSNIAQTWKTADDVANDMASWLSSVYNSGGERLYDEMVDTINSVIEDFDPSY